MIRYIEWLTLLLLLTLTECKVTMEQTEKTGEMIRGVCQPRVKITTEMADGIMQGKFPNDKSLKCYVHCVMEMTGMMKKNKLNYDAAMKQMDKIFPEELVDENRKAITVCKDEANGIKDACEAGYILIQCMYKNNKKFVFA